MSNNHLSRRSVLTIDVAGVGAALAGCGGDDRLFDRYFDMCLEIPYLNKEAK